MGSRGALIELGLNHEQQHQELILTDILHALSCNPLLPAYHPVHAPGLRLASVAAQPRWIDLPGGTVHIGHGGEGFAFDNETPRHPVLLAPYRIADRLVTCGEYARSLPTAVMSGRPCGCPMAGRPCTPAAGGARSIGSRRRPGAPAAYWQVFGLHGVRPIDPAAPVCHLSYYEAAAFAGWAGARLPTESEWEAADRRTRYHAS